MLCKVCVCILRGGTGELWTGTHDLTFQHHASTATLRRSREADCTICIALANVLRQEIDLLEDQNISIRASLRRLVDGRPDESNYRLDFDIEKKHTRTYLLKQSKPSNRRLRTPRSLDTSSDEVFEVACNWIKDCKCADFWTTAEEKWYPKRLLDLTELRSANGLRQLEGSRLLSNYGNLEHTKVRLVEPSELSMHEMDENIRYVTLSHCWGKPKSVQGQLKLTSKTEQRFKKDGIELRELPKSFRDAILFACRLEQVGYIWIDSFCIKQAIAGPGADPKDSEDDWLAQSRVMDKVYRHSYLNISATAATDGDQGLFFPRRPEYLWEDEINVNYTGSNSFSSMRSGAAETDELTRCTLIDLSFWDELVEQAPVNKRGWVLQERLMAPRVLHFCHNQIAWECAEFQDAEGYPERDPTLKAKLGDIVDEGRLKSLTPEDGLALRENRLKEYPDPDKDMEGLPHYELWKRVVEVYSRTKLSVSRDKLVALSGIARFFSRRINCDYVAGLWRNHLESQLLWQVVEVFRDGVFENPARRDTTRAPSFSWASIDSPHGIIYGEATSYGKDRDDELFIAVQHHEVIPADPMNPFGLIEKGEIILQAKYLQPVEIRRLQPPFRVPYSWSLKEAGSYWSNPPIEHYNLDLDAPESDSDIFKSDARLWCMPVAFGERTVRKASRYLICLLLKSEGTSELDTDSPPVFKRVGITKLSNYGDERGQHALRRTEVNKVICLR